MPKKVAIEMLIFKPNSDILPEQRGVHENLWIKERFEQYLSVCVYRERSDLKYYLFANCDNSPEVYASLDELKQHLPEGLEDILENEPKLFIMGHGHGGRYGLGNIHGPSEQILDDNFDRIVEDV